MHSPSFVVHCRGFYVFKCGLVLARTCSVKMPIRDPAKRREIQTKVARKAALQDMGERKPMGGVPSDHKGSLHQYTPVERELIRDYFGNPQNHNIMNDCERMYQNANALTKRFLNGVPVDTENRSRQEAAIRERDETHASRHALGGDLKRFRKN